MNDRNARLDALLARSLPVIKGHWEAYREGGMAVMTPANTDAVDAVILAYFQRLKALEDPATDAQILAEMKRLYAELDAINAKADNGLLETDEREEFVPIFVEAAEICGIDSTKYDGEPGGEYREF